MIARVGGVKYLRLLLIWGLLAAGLFGFSASAPGAPEPEEQAGAEVKVSEEHGGRRVDLKRGQILVVDLEASPSTGFTWEMDEGPT